MKKANIEWGFDSMEQADLTILNGQVVVALIVGAIRADRFCEDTLKHFLESGKIAKWLSFLKEVDEV